MRIARIAYRRRCGTVPRIHRRDLALRVARVADRRRGRTVVKRYGRLALQSEARQHQGSGEGEPERCFLREHAKSPSEVRGATRAPALEDQRLKGAEVVPALPG